jgi:hypothetical protein
MSGHELEFGSDYWCWSRGHSFRIHRHVMTNVGAFVSHSPIVLRVVEARDNRQQAIALDIAAICPVHVAH